MSNTYGKWLKAQREAAGLTQQELATLALMTRSHISHIEAGRRVPSEEDARRLDLALGTGNVLTSFRPGADGDAVADYFAPVRHFEQQATAIREFAPALVPGILQTEAYARAVLGRSFPSLSQAERDRAVVARLERARILKNQASPVVWAVLDEAVLRRPIGGAEVMAEQIDHIVALTESERIRAHVIPLGLGYHPLLDGMLTLMWFDDQPPVAYSEGLRVGRLHDSPSVVEAFEADYTLALSDALPLQESLAALKATSKGYRGHG
ncbi:helix-turn-helix domain-containing protein [Streptomyces bacillaris]|uniref:XRE family transcriptional regulator n=1 Tax=Streptomyces rhizosphaericola TaxID=2564098 RepID=A0ABY2PKC3_9ACTN|nr:MULTISPECIES: helix-turn-helix transcriptional regulator [Streptomyces]ARI54420.1 transcriptional regulator [Streptomyces sp. S8]NGO85003.1 helix-turn-helix domain-containing protein [Streptomyces sp. 196(2019)]TGZ10830.1 XRE family transcriptional regulator [Streptomyces rhizosphaericola]